MTNEANLDEFDQELEEGVGPAPKSGGLKENLVDAWKSQPLFKLLVIMAVVGVAISGALGVFSSPPPGPASKVVSAPNLHEVPGGVSTPAFIEQNDQANADRVDRAMQKGGSAMPTPVGQNLDFADLNGKKKEDPLAEFRTETERLKQEINLERQQNAQQMQTMQQQMRQQQQKPAEKEDDTLAQAMQHQMQQMMDAWAPKNIKVVKGTGTGTSDVAGRQVSENIQRVSGDAGTTFQQKIAAARAQEQQKAKIIVQSGTVSYGQMLMEANSDIPGPILAQVLSGPLAGGRAIGRFETMNDYLVIQFNLINFKGKDYPVNILALNPDTTLGGMATDVDHRYFDRVLLPAAASFASQFGSTLSQGKTTTTVTDNAVLIDQAKSGYKEAMYSGLGSAAQSISQFLQQEASQTKPLVRVAVGTPLGMFFLTSVKESGSESEARMPVAPWGNTASSRAGLAGATGTGASAYSPLSVYGNGTLPMSANTTAAGFFPSSTTSSSIHQIPGTSLTVITK